MINIIVLLLAMSGKISGIVRDKETKKPLPFALIKIENMNKGAFSDEEGKYVIDNLKPGEYTLICSYTGYRPLKKLKVFVFPARITEVNFELEKTSYEMKGIEVKAKSFSGEEIESPSSHVISFREAYYKPGSFSDIQKVVQFLPSVSGRDNLNELIVRGGNPDENLIVIDNIEMGNLSYLPMFGSGGGGIFIFDEWLLDELRFNYGVLPVRYGDKISSVLEISMKKGNSDKIQIEMEPGIGGGRFHIEGPFKNKNSFNIIGGISDDLWFLRVLKKLSPEIREGFKEIGIPEKLLITTLQGNITFEGNKSLLELVGIYGGNDLIIKSLPFKDDSIDVFNKNYTYCYGLNLYRFFKRGYLLLTLSSGANEWNWINRETSDGTLVLKNLSKSSFYRIRFENKLKFNFSLLYGIEYKMEKFNYNYYTQPDSLFYYEYSPQNPDSVINKVLIDVRKENINSINYSYKISSYLEIKFNLWRFITRLGIREDYFDYIKEAVSAPRLVLSLPFEFYKIPFYFNIGMGRHYQSPNPVILYSTPKNKNLKYYFADIYTMGINFLPFKDLKFSFEFYFKDYYRIPVNKAYTTKEPNDWTKVYLPVGRSYTKGVDIYIQKKFFKSLFFNLGFSHSYSCKKDLRTGNWVYNDFDQRNILGISFGYRVFYREKEWFKNIEKNKIYKILKWIPVINLFTLFLDDEAIYSVSLRYATGKPYTYKTYLKEYKRWLLLENTPMNTGRLPPYFRVDVRINTKNLYTKFLGIPCNSEMYIEFINITNHKNVYDYFYVDKTGERIEIKQLPFTVSAGWIIKF